MNIDCPSQLTDRNAVQYINDIWKAKAEDTLTLNLSTLNFVYPAGLFILAVGIRNLIIQGNNLEAGGVNPNSIVILHLVYIGFFKFAGINFKNNHPNFNHNKTLKKRNYIPITTIERKIFSNENLAIQDQIVIKSNELAKLIYSNDISKADMLSYCLREVIRNVFEHAETDECYLMAQKLKDGDAEIAIADQGIGILGSLSKVHQINNSKSALLLALQPGISENTYPINNDTWQNSGFGLYVISQIGNKYGEFALLSNNTMLMRKNNVDSWLSTEINGTIVKLRANTKNAEYFSNILPTIVKEGEKEAMSIPGAIKTASKSSGVLEPLW